MAINCTHTNNPADAQYCIDCGALIAYEGNTQRLETERLVEEMQRPSASIAPNNYQRRYVPSDDIEDEPLFITQEQLIKLLHCDPTEIYGDYMEYGPYLSDKRYIMPKGKMYYYGREIIIIDEE